MEICLSLLKNPKAHDKKVSNKKAKSGNIYIFFRMHLSATIIFLR